MTNVPPKLREMWADAYRLFDIYYKMENNEESWEKFWHDAGGLMAKYKKYHIMDEMVLLITKMIENRIRMENNTFTSVETENLF